MFDRLIGAFTGTEAALAELDARSMIGTQPVRGLELLQRHERAVAAARARLTARAGEMRQWQREGFRSFDEWYAATFGTSFGQAKKKTRAARNLADNDDVAGALADGDISEDEADVVADAAKKNPDAEKDLLDTAKSQNKSHNDLKDEAAKAKAAGEDDGRRADRLRRGRQAGWHQDREGFWSLNGRFQPEVGAEMQARLQAETDRVFARARSAGMREPIDRYRADALAALLVGPERAAADNTPSERQLDLGLGPERPGEPGAAVEPGPSTRTARPGKTMVLGINLETLRRGCVNPGETRHVRGVGQVPVEVARSWVDDAFVKAVIRDGTDVKKVVHYGRHVPARVRTALELIDQTCTVPGCSSRRMELDHARRHADHGPSSVANLRPLCPHHRQRTHDGFELEGEPGDRRWLDPDGRVLFADQSHHLTAEPARAP